MDPSSHGQANNLPLTEKVLPASSMVVAGRLAAIRRASSRVATVAAF
jgi:hypothetical protein